MKLFILSKIFDKTTNEPDLKTFIESRKRGFDDIIGEKGLKISTGQRQRIAARALYKNSKLIIFDEATSSLDEETEKNIMDTIFSLSRKNYTSIIISHKLSNLKSLQLKLLQQEHHIIEL